MNITDILAQTGGLQSMARELGISEPEAARGAEALGPAVLGGFKRQAQAPSGIEGLAGMLGQLGGSGLLENLLGSQPTDVGRGNDVLGQIFGSKDVSRAVAAKASNQSGLDQGLLKRMLPMVAMAVAGYMAQRGGTSAPSQEQGGLAGMVSGLLGGGGRQSGAGGIASMLDMDGDGNPLDDILRMMGR